MIVLKALLLLLKLLLLLLLLKHFRWRMRWQGIIWRRPRYRSHRLGGNRCWIRRPRNGGRGMSGEPLIRMEASHWSIRSCRWRHGDVDWLSVVGHRAADDRHRKGWGAYAIIPVIVLMPRMRMGWGAWPATTPAWQGEAIFLS